MTVERKKVLVCDDDAAILRVLEVNLQIEGYEVLTAKDGEEAVQLALESQPDLVILDVMMPRLDGYQACEKMKANDELRETPVIFLSARGERADIAEARSLGAAEYLTKPFDPMELLERVAKLLA